MSDDETQTIQVLANPFCAALDAKGRTFGRLYMESNQAQHKMPPRFVGARLIARVIRQADKKKQVEGLEDHVMVYDPTPQTVPLTAYYLRALSDHGHHGAPIFLADLESHKLVHGSEKGFRHPLARIAQTAAEREATPVFAGAPVAEGAVAPDHKDPEVVAHFQKVVGEAVAADQAAAKDRAAKAQAQAEAAAKAKAGPPMPQAQTKAVQS